MPTFIKNLGKYYFRMIRAQFPISKAQFIYSHVVYHASISGSVGNVLKNPQVVKTTRSSTLQLCSLPRFFVMLNLNQSIVLSCYKWECVSRCHGQLGKQVGKCLEITKSSTEQHGIQKNREYGALLPPAVLHCFFYISRCHAFAKL